MPYRTLKAQLAVSGASIGLDHYPSLERLNIIVSNRMADPTKTVAFIGNFDFSKIYLLSS